MAECCEVSLVLSGGGVRACAQIGFYEELLKNDIKVDCVAGTSMGAVIGACIAMDLSPEKMIQQMKKFKKAELVNLKNFNYFNESLFKYDFIAGILEETFDGLHIEDTKIPFACTAVDLESKREVYLKEGPLVTALSASTAFPSIFPPVYYEGSYLVDGGILDNVPAPLAREMGAKKIIAIDIRNTLVQQKMAGYIYLKHINKKPKCKKPWRFIKRFKDNMSFFTDIILESFDIASSFGTDFHIKKGKPDILFSPIINVGLMDFEEVDSTVEIGRQLARDNMNDIKKMLNS